MRFFLLAILSFTLFAKSVAQTSAAPADRPTTTKPVTGPVSELSLTDAVILGVVEGVTEFLPVSSTGHLVIASRVLGLESEQPLSDANGQPLWYRKPSAKYPGGVPLTVKLATDTYLVVIQIGAIAAVALLYWSQFMAMLRGLLGRDPEGLRLLICVIVAFIPAAGLGFLLSDWIEKNLFSIKAVIIAQIAGAFLMFFAEWWRRKNPTPVKPPTTPLSSEMSVGRALTIGTLQCAALWPGTSRSMMTIVGGYFVGLDPRRSAEFSFLLGFVTLSAASVYKGYKSGAAMIQVFGWSNIIIGGVFAAITAFAFVKLLVHMLTRNGLAIFAWYRLAMAAVLTVYFYL